MAAEPEVIRDKSQMRSWSRCRRVDGKTIALVPTMGSLHAGHLALVAAARSAADLIVVSIYLNPAQFAPSEDLAAYPADFDADLRALRAAGGVDVVFCPHDLYAPPTNSRVPSSEGEGGDGAFKSCIEGIGGSGHETWIRVERLERGLCGKSRPVFFRGVATVVAKLFNIVEPDAAVFGKKDYQQWRVIRRMALSISKSLSKAKFAAENGKNTSQELKDLVIQAVTEAGGRVDYVEIVEQENLKAVEEIASPVVMCVAAWFGNVRLIDNMEISI